MSNEADLKKLVKERLTLRNVWYYMIVPNGYSRRGVPDFICCGNGAFFSIETKAPGKTASEWQLRENLAIQKAGGAAIISDSFEDIAAFVDSILAGKR